MVLYTKSIQREPQKEDGYRICIMRNPAGYEGKYNKWMPSLAPSAELRARTKQNLGWDAFKDAYLAELKLQDKALKYVIERAKRESVTLLCVEDTPDHCHRSLVAQEIKKSNPELEVVIR